MKNICKGGPRDNRTFGTIREHERIGDYTPTKEIDSKTQRTIWKYEPRSKSQTEPSKICQKPQQS